MTQGRRRALGHARTALDIVTRLGVPLALAQAILRTPSSGGVAMAALLAAYVSYIMLVGQWRSRAALLVPAACLMAIPVGLVRRGDAVLQSGGLAAATLAGGLAAVFLVRTYQALRGRADLPGDAIELGLPLGPGRYLVAQGGSRRVLNAHLACLDMPHLRGQSFAVDIVGSTGVAITALPFRCQDPASYAIFGREVLAPADAVVVHVADGSPDLPPPETDPERPMGNHVWLKTDGPGGDVLILLAHLRAGSITVEAGTAIRRGEIIAQVGNSGNTSEPHLHIHAQTPPRGSADPLTAAPVPMRFGGLGQLHRGRRFCLD